MEYLELELERALRVLEGMERSERNLDPLISKLGSYEPIDELIARGYAKRRDSVEFGTRISRTVRGRGYFAQKLRDTLRRWAPVLASACIGVFGTLLGVIATLVFS